MYIRASIAGIVLAAVAACAGVDRGEAEPQCVLPTSAAVLFEQDGAVLLSWEFEADAVFEGAWLPTDPAFVAYRTAVERDGADVRRPVSDAPVITTEAERRMWQAEYVNNDLAYDQGVGDITSISCLDALLFSVQAERVSQLEQPTEFLASVLRRSTPDTTELAIVFGAGSEMFPPREAYGLEVVDRYLAEGWSYWYALHNHTLQRNGDALALGVPVPSTSDVAFARSLAQQRQLETVRVTNGFYTFSAPVEALVAFRAR